MNKELMTGALMKVVEGLQLAIIAWDDTSIVQASGKVEATPTTEVVAAPAKRAKKTKTEAVVTKAEEAFDLDEETTVEAKEVSAEELRTKLVEYAQKNTKEKAWALLAKYGAKKINDIDPKKYGAIYKEIAL